MLHIGPAAFRNRGHVEAVARSNERRLVFGEAVEAALAVEAIPIIGAAVFPLRLLHARGRGDIEKAISHDGPLLRQPIGCANPVRYVASFQVEVFRDEYVLTAKP
jgi:hypothetical protein